MAGTFELKTTKSGKTMFNLKAANGQVVLTSEQYESKAAARNGVASVRINGAHESRYEVRETSSGKPYFVLKARNGQEIGRSQFYASDATRKKGMASVMKNAAGAQVVDLTD